MMKEDNRLAILRMKQAMNRKKCADTEARIWERYYDGAHTSAGYGKALHAVSAAHDKARERDAKLVAAFEKGRK